MQRSPLRRGPAARTRGPVLVSVTDFHVHRARDIPRVITTGMRLRRSWPQRPGAVGLWTWIDIPGRRVGSVSVWKSEADLQRFVRSPEHLAIMRDFRTVMSGTATAWQARRFARGATWRQAKRRLSRAAGGALFDTR
jgi:hypothetical protein